MYVSSRLAQHRLIQFSTWNKTPRCECETHRDKVARGIRCSNHHGGVAKDSSVGAGGYEIGENDEEREDDFDEKSLQR